MTSKACVNLMAMTFLLLCCSALASAQDKATTLAAQLRAKTGMARGICALPRAGDGKLALAFAQAGFLVHAMHTNVARVDAMRADAAGAGLLNRSLYVEAGAITGIPLADTYANLLVIPDVTDKELATLPLAEFLRVLVPGTGTAVIGLANGTPGVLTPAALTAWTKGITGGDATVAQDASGLWAIIVKNAKPGAVPWTHRLYSPANNPVTTDTACAWPLMTQWLSRPYLAAQPIVLIANGRMAAIRLEGWGSESTLEVFDAHNSMLLWRRKMPDASVATRTSGMVLLPTALYVAEGANVLIFDPATGMETGRIDCSTLGEQVKWVAIEGDTLYAMAGSKEKTVMSSQTWTIFGDIPANFTKGSAIGAYTLSKATWRWTDKVAEELLTDGMIGMCNGRVYYYVVGKALICRDAVTGNVVWENPNIVTKVTDFIKGDTRGHVGALMCTDQYLVIHKASSGTVVMSAATGEPLWTTMAATVVIAKDTLLRKGGANWGNPPAFDAATGKPSITWPKMNLGGGCGSFTITPNLLCGQTGVTYDFQAKKNLDSNGNGPLFHKTPCLSGSFVGDGLLVFGSVTCQCGYGVRGTIVQASAPTLPTIGQVVTQQLQQVDAKVMVAPLAIEAGDWPIFRANVERGNASAATIPATAAVQWAWPALPEGEVALPALPREPQDSNREPMQVTTVGKWAFVGESDGRVTALDTVTGAVRWRVTTGGRLFASPTIADGRCYIGSGDGYLYCLEATTGRTLWRYRVAPVERRLMVYGDLLSNWPITGGVLVQEGVAYAAAGIFDVDGTYVVALDARTGAVKWRNDTSGHLNAQRNTGVAACGFPAIAKGRLWIRNASYNLATGECHPFTNPKVTAPDQANDVFQRYTGFFGKTFLVTGGRRFFDDQTQKFTDGDSDGAFFVEVGEDGLGKYPINVPWEHCRTMPAWDDRSLIAMPSVRYTAKNIIIDEDLLCWDSARTIEAMRKATENGSDKTTWRAPWSPYFLKTPTMDKSKGDKFQDPQQLWTAQSGWYLASVLTTNAVVAAHGVPPANAKAAMTYAVTAYNRTTGAQLWQVDLPGQPLMDGLSITRDGQVLVRLLDGRLICIGNAG